MHHDVSPTPRTGTQPAEEPAGAPTPEALFATRVAGQVARQLFEAGQEVRFALVPDRERVWALLCDDDGLVLSRLTPSRVLEIATGEPVPGGRR
ncbi:MAG TPA: hypothetical protein VMY78_12035 [Solirubrobacteraceae bacterium]|nr:hypothetical protein [Solirubrobacteraceae bacterium]